MNGIMTSLIIIMAFVSIIIVVAAAQQAALAQKGLSPQELKGYNKFIEDWKRACPDSNNMTAFCDGYLTGASIRSSGP